MTCRLKLSSSVSDNKVSRHRSLHSERQRIVDPSFKVGELKIFKLIENVW